MKFSLLGTIALKLLLSGSWAFSSSNWGIHYSTIDTCNKGCGSKPNMYCNETSLTCQCQHGMSKWAASSNYKCLQNLGGDCRVSDWKTGKNIFLPCTPNAECSEGENRVCKCSEGYYASNGACRPFIGRSCKGNDQCGVDAVTRSQLVCRTGKCSCNPSNSVYASVSRNARYGGGDAKGLCAPLATKQCFEGFCAPRAECSSCYYMSSRRYWAGGYYTDSAVCDCSSPYTLNERTMECSAPYGEICNLDIPCNDGLVCDGSTSRCRCASDQFYDTKQNKCVKELESVCKTTNECIQNANCNNSKCHCKSGYVQLGTGRAAKCTASHGFSCIQDSDCDQTNNLMCVGTGTRKTCTCKSGLKFFPKSGRCNLPHGSVCNWATTCGDDMKCTKGICKCFDRMYFDWETQSCVKSDGEACVYGTDCGTNAFCNQGVCRCKEAYVSVPAGGCAADFGTACRSFADCAQTPNELICRNKTCACKSGLVRSSTTKRCSLQYGSLCDGAIPCADKLVCKGTCTCPEGQYFRSNQCITYAGEKCRSQEDCISNADCRNEICVCKPGYVQSSGRQCRPDHGSQCFIHSDCDQSKNELRCSKSKTCDCQPGLKMSNGRCSLQFEAACNNTIPCFNNLVCNGTCACPEGRDFRNERCANLAGERCTVNDDCLFNSECRNQACICKKGYVQTATKMCAPDFGSPCSQSINCDQSKNNLTCDSNGICSCPFNLAMSIETGRCSLPVEASCNGSIPCGNSLVCKQSKCQCPIRSQDFDKISSRCLHRVGGPCIETSDCIAGTFCDPSYYSSSQNVSHCNCPHGTVETRDRRCINNTRTDCRKDSDCDTAAGLECMDSKCRCSTNAIYSPETRMCLGYVGTQCLPNPTSFTATESRHEVVDSCIPNAVCGKRTSSTPIYECLCSWPKFIEAENSTCIRSPDYVEQTEKLTSSTSTTTPMTTTERTTTTTATSTASAVVCTPVASATTQASAPSTALPTTKVESPRTETSTIPPTKPPSTESVTSTSGPGEHYSDSPTTTTAPAPSLHITSTASTTMSTTPPEEVSADPDEFPDESAEDTMYASTTASAPSMNETFNTRDPGPKEDPTTKHPLGLGELVEYI